MTEYSTRFKVVSWGFSYPDVLSSCPAHVYTQWRSKTNPSLPQKFDVQSECKGKTDAHKTFDEMSNRYCPEVFIMARSKIPIKMAMAEGDNGNLDNKHIMGVGDSTHEISTLTLSLSTLTESSFKDGKSKEGTEVKEQVEGSKDVVQQKLIATTNIHVELAPEEFSSIFQDFSLSNLISATMPLSESLYVSCIHTQSLFTIFTSDACLHDIQSLNKIKFLGTILFCGYVDDWFYTGQDFEADSCRLLSVDSEEITQVSHEESWLISFRGCEYLQLHDENFMMANKASGYHFGDREADFVGTQTAAQLL